MEKKLPGGCYLRDIEEPEIDLIPIRHKAETPEDIDITIDLEITEEPGYWFYFSCIIIIVMLLMGWMK